jgi:integrase
VAAEALTNRPPLADLLPAGFHARRVKPPPMEEGLHTLRHSAASVMLSAGVPLKVISEIFGHASVAITGDVYGRVSPDVCMRH